MKKTYISPKCDSLLDDGLLLLATSVQTNGGETQFGKASTGSNEWADSRGSFWDDTE